MPPGSIQVMDYPKGGNEIMKSMKCSALITAMLAMAALAGKVYGAEDEAALGRAIASKWEKAIVTVQVVLKARMSVEGREMGSYEHKAEATGTVVDPSGLTLISLSQINPDEAMRGPGEDEGQYDYKVELGDVKIRLADGKEIPASVVLRDKDLDMAFIRPKQKQTSPFACVSLAEQGSLQVLDSCIVLARLGKVANRALAVSWDRVQAVVDKPRKLYVTGLSSAADEVGGAVFSMDGKLVGVILLRSVPGDGGDYDWQNRLPMVLPAADIIEAAKQAPAEPPKETPEPAQSKAAAPKQK